MKSVLLNNAGYTAYGQWRLVKVDPTNEMSLAGNEALKQGGFFTSKADYFRAIDAAKGGVVKHG